MQDREVGGDEAARLCRFLAALPLFDGVDSAVLRGLVPHFCALQLTAGERLCEEGADTLETFVVVSGSLRLLGASGPTPTPVLLAPGSVYAHRGVSVYSSAAIQAVAPSEVLTVPWATLSTWLQAQPLVRDRIIAETGRHVRRLQLASTSLFRPLDDAWLSQVADQSELVDVKRGEIVMHEGGEPDCLYVVVRGSLEVFRTRESGGSTVADILGDGASVGEMGVLMKEPRSLSVRARRDSTLIRVSAAVFERVLHQNAEVTLQLAGTLSARLKRTTSSVQRSRPMTTIAVLRSCEELAFAAFFEGLLPAFGRAGHRVAVFSRYGLGNARGGPGETGTDEALDRGRLADALAGAERAHDYVLCRCDIPSSDWTGWCLLQADVILVVGRSATAPPASAWPPELTLAATNGTRIELALVRGAGTLPQGTGAWLDRAAFHAHHHLVADSAPDLDRLVRRLSARAWGLVLSGGGAKGFAHIGVIRALREGGFPIDMVGGTSMGAILAAQYAMGCDDREMLALTRRVYLGRPVRSDLTLPLVALHSGRATSGRLRTMFDDRRIEDLPTAYFCVSCNLTRAQVDVHDRGPVWFWARVSCSVPGILPPVPYRGDVLVDGGLLDNLPVGEMRRRLGGFVAAVDVSVAVDLGVDSGLAAQAPWSGASQIVRLLTGRPRLPNIVNVLMRTAEISSVRDSRVAGSPADLYLHVPVEGIGMTDFQSIDRIVEIGYEYAARRLEEYQRPSEYHAS